MAAPGPHGVSRPQGSSSGENNSKLFQKQQNAFLLLLLISVMPSAYIRFRMAEVDVFVLFCYFPNCRWQIFHKVSREFHAAKEKSKDVFAFFCCWYSTTPNEEQISA